MTDAQFTPGPWEADVALGCVVAPSQIHRAPRGKRLVVADTEYEGSARILADGERAANTHLIAAAPDLYEMTELFARSIEYQIRKDESEGDDEGARLKTATLNRVRAALAKVTTPDHARDGAT